MSPEALALVPLDLLLGEVFRRCGLTVVAPMSAPMSAPTHRGHADIPMSAMSAVSTPELEQRRARWRRQKQAQRSRRTADMSTADKVVVNTRTTTTTVDMSTADTADADMSTRPHLPGLETAGPTPAPVPAPPDDLVRRKLRTGTIELLARQAVDRARAAGTVVVNPPGYQAAAQRAIGVDRADEITAGIEAALTRWVNPDAAHVVTCIDELARPAAGARVRRVEQPVDRPPLPPRHEVTAGLAAVRNALTRTA